MTRFGRDYGETMVVEAFQPVAADVNFATNRFPDYTFGANNRMDAKVAPEVPSMKDIVARETAQLIEQQKRLSVRDLTSKFEKGLAAAAKLSEEAKVRNAASHDRHVLLKKLRDVLESLRGRVVGRNKEDIEEAISMVEALAAQLTHKEGELLQEKAEVKKLAILLKQVADDAKKAAEVERTFARAEIENARAAVRRVEQTFEEQEQKARISEKQDLEQLMNEVREARRIKMLHQPSKVMDMELELQALRTQVKEKSMYSLQLCKELAMCRRLEENKSLLYELDGCETLGSCLRVRECTDVTPDISKCTILWFRVSSDRSKRDSISGATKPLYAPEPFDVGRFLEAQIIFNDQTFILSTTGLIEPAAGLGSYVEALVRKTDPQFNVVVTQVNGQENPSYLSHVLHVGKMRIKLCKGRITKAKENYSSGMQLCGVRGGGNAAAQALFWQPKKGRSFTIAFESDRERNAAIMLARRFAFEYNIVLGGPHDRVPSNS